MSKQPTTESTTRPHRLPPERPASKKDDLPPHAAFVRVVTEHLQAQQEAEKEKVQLEKRIAEMNAVKTHNEDRIIALFVDSFHSLPTPLQNRVKNAMFNGKAKAR